MTPPSQGAPPAANTDRHVFEKAKTEAASAMDAVMTEAARKNPSAAAR
jgi:hypothetical protein